MKKILFLIIISSFTGLQPAEAQKNKKQRKQDIKKVLRYAKSYIGTPYKYGGTSHKGVDCSSLIQNSFASANYKIPRVSKEQSKYGKKVSWKSLKPGDVVFFKFRKKGKKWNHSGLITKVNGKDVRFIHASSSKGVVESNLMANYYKNNVIGFRRIIK